MPRFLLSALAALLVACSSGGTAFEFFLPDGKTLAIRFETRVEKRRPDGKAEVDSTALVSRLQVVKGGRVGRDPIQLATRIDQVRVDRRPFLGDDNVVWDSASGEPPGEEFEIDALMLGLSYDVLLQSDLEAVVSSLRWPDRPNQPAEAEWMKRALTSRAIADDFAGSFRALPRGRRKLGARWRTTTAVSAPLTGAKSEVAIWWTFRSLEDGVATLVADMEKATARGAEVTSHSGKLRYDVANQLPLEQTTSLVAIVDVGGEPYTIETTQTATYRLE